MNTLLMAPLQGARGKLVRFASWLVLGPITGSLAFLFVADLRAGRRIRALMWVGLGVAFWTLAPMLLGVELDYVRRPGL
ncbi:MAG TPA: hypothetical protein VGI79_22475 [Caulobacteraceae bacterium]|jgi:hypothetical protein